MEKPTARFTACYGRAGATPRIIATGARTWHHPVVPKRATIHIPRVGAGLSISVNHSVLLNQSTALLSGAEAQRLAALVEPFSTFELELDGLLLRACRIVEASELTSVTISYERTAMLEQGKSDPHAS